LKNDESGLRAVEGFPQRVRPSHVTQQGAVLPGATIEDKGKVSHLQPVRKRADHSSEAVLLNDLKEQ
jgi:hypothetical protein